MINKIKSFVINNNNRHIVIGSIVILLVIILSITLIGNTFSIGDNITINEVEDIISNKEDTVIYVFNTNSSNKHTSKILNHLKDKDINFRVYDVSKVESDEYKKILEIFSINSEIFNYPAIIYIKDGVMFANIINIEDLNVVDKFIEDYDLKISV